MNIRIFFGINTRMPCLFSPYYFNGVSKAPHQKVGVIARSILKNTAVANFSTESDSFTSGPFYKTPLHEPTCYSKNKPQNDLDGLLKQKPPKRLRDIIYKQYPEFFNATDMSVVYRSIKDKLDGTGNCKDLLDPQDPENTLEKVAQYVNKFSLGAIVTFCKEHGIDQSIVDNFVAATKGLVEQSKLIDEINEKGCDQLDRDSFTDLLNALHYWTGSRVSFLRANVVVGDDCLLRGVMIPLYNIDYFTDLLRSELSRGLSY